MDANVRESTVDSFSRDWQEAHDAGVALERAYHRLTDQMNVLAGSGCHILIEFPSPLMQQWWVAYRETQGDLIPRHPEDAPIPVVT